MIQLFTFTDARVAGAGWTRSGYRRSNSPFLRLRRRARFDNLIYKSSTVNLNDIIRLQFHCVAPDAECQHHAMALNSSSTRTKKSDEITTLKALTLFLELEQPALEK